MKLPKPLITIKLVTISVLFFTCLVSSSQEINTILMNNTFEIFGPSNTIGNTLGTIFLMGKSSKINPLDAYPVLITATHVLDGISGDVAMINFRRKDDNGIYITYPTPIKIRDKGHPIYISNKDADVSVMYVGIPSTIDITLLLIDFLVDDAQIMNTQLHPGDELFCLGFPLGIDFDGFPVLRTGTLASYPLTPSKLVKKYMYTFHVFPGNSGGPVYFSYHNRQHIGPYITSMNAGPPEQGILGLVSQQLSSVEPAYKDLPLDIAVVVPSSYIKETIAMLPDEPNMP